MVRLKTAQSVLEYTVIIGFIIAALVAVSMTFKTKVSEKLQKSGETINSQATTFEDKIGKKES